jgi:hypothetical protein
VRTITAISLFLWSCGSKHPTLFRAIASDHSHIYFNNRVIENDSVNPIDLEFLYNGGGVAVGDFNRDGLMDLYFTGSEVSNKLYLNQGGLSFRDVTDIAKVSGEGRWCTGVAVVDINNDGWPDIYVCVSIKKDPAQRTNLLYVNQGPDENGIPVFKEMAAQYGLADTSYSVQAAFFDYDNDGDLDMFLTTTKMAQREVAQFSTNGATADARNVGKLYRNDWNDSLGHPFFTDVSKQAGITYPGYGLGVSIVDLNRDGWKDIYVTNDFLSSDLLYINNKDGTFTNKVGDYFKHTSQNAMGNDIADIDNDGLADVLTVDMNPPDNYRKKRNLGGGNYTIYQNMLYGNYMLQYVRNTLQWNRGPRVGSHDSLGDPVFSDIGFYAGVAETDWSWNPSIADFDNDGYRDILITNGYPRDVTDHDFIAFRQRSAATVPKRDLLAQIPQIKIPNYAFHNTGARRFDDVTQAWGISTPSFSNGAVYVDLDNDGDLDYVVNNINDAAFVFENTTNEAGPASATNPSAGSGSGAAKRAPGFLDIAFKGGPGNRDGLGTWAEIYYGRGQHQVYENSPYRGYLSTVAPSAHFGLNNYNMVDSVLIKWYNGKMQVLQRVPADTRLLVDIHDATIPYSFDTDRVAHHPLFTDVTADVNIHYQHHERDYIDFNAEKLLPHKLSQYGPALAAGDLNGDGLDDLVIGASAGETIHPYLLQQKDGTFSMHTLPDVRGKDLSYPENTGILIFDADDDGLPDLYCNSGSNEFPAGTANYQDRLWMNDGKGGFALDTAAIPINHTSKSCVRASDVDNDGDLDLFIGGRVLPGNYPQPVSSFIYRNDSRPGHPKFTDVTATVAPDLQSLGMVCDGIWTDFDNDGWTDLIVVGEWMPITFFHNDHGKLVDVTAASGVSGEKGWWNSIVAGDFDNDGDIDYIIGNAGLNSFFHASKDRPVSIYAKDFDLNKSLDAIITTYLTDQQGRLQEFPVASRDDLMQQLPVLKKRFLTYGAYGKARFADLFTPDELQGTRTLRANNLQSVYLENLGNSHFRIRPLPAEAQLAPLYGMVVDDFNGDGNLDVAISGNDYGNEVTNGRYDALNGLVLLGDGKGNFSPQTISQSGLFIPGDGKALVELGGPGGKVSLAVAQNNGPLKIFCNNTRDSIIRLRADDKVVWFTLANGRMRRQECYYGSSFSSQSARIVRKGPAVKKIEMLNSSGSRRTVYDRR